MSTYEELSLIVSVALLIVTILNYTKKIARPDPAKVDELFSIVFLFAGTGKWWFPSGFPVKYIICQGNVFVKYEKPPLLPTGTA